MIAIFPGTGIFVNSTIVLTTLNARYAHTAFGLRYLKANLGPLSDHAAITEFNIRQPVAEVTSRLLSANPTILGIGVYIWNVAMTTDVVRQLKKERPEMTIVLGGPEVSYECDRQHCCDIADYIICGEGESAFASLCRQLLAGEMPDEKVIIAGRPALDELILPYDLYTAEDIAHRVIYVESSRGCPFGCEFCLSSLDDQVRCFTLDPFLDAMQKLMDRGVRQFKFVDRTFNLNESRCCSVLSFFLDRYQPGMFLHFEMIPDRLPDKLLDLIVQFPTGSIQFEAGVQSFNSEVLDRIGRRQDMIKTEANLLCLRKKTGVHIHADLIVGLPGEDVSSIRSGFDRLIRLEPQEIQVGILKRLRGSPIVRHDDQWGMVYSHGPPYEIIQNSLIDAPMIARLKRFARYWDRIGNSGNFVHTKQLIWQQPADDTNLMSPFDAMLQLSDRLYEKLGRTHGIALIELMEQLFIYLTRVIGHDCDRVARTLWSDYRRCRDADCPVFLRDYVDVASQKAVHRSGIPPRQSRHMLS